MAEKKIGKSPALRPTRRSIMGAALAGSAATMLPAQFNRVIGAESKKAKKPNILFIYADQYRPELYGAAGAKEIYTPHIDRLAREGTRFSRMWCQGPICRPARAALMTGKYPHQIGISNNLGSGQFNPAWPNYVRALKQAGYSTAIFGKTHFNDIVPGKAFMDMRDNAPFIQSFGFDHVIEEPEHSTPIIPLFVSSYSEFLRANGYLEIFQQEMKAVERAGRTPYATVVSSMPQEMDLTSYLADQTVDWLKKRDRTKPFFAMYGPAKPHYPFQADATWAAYYAGKEMPKGPRTRLKAYDPAWAKWLDDRYKHSQPEEFDEYELANIRRVYYAMISLLDQKIGELIAFLEKDGSLDNTWIVFSSDHGEMLWDHGITGKFIFQFPSVGVPGIIRPPYGKPKISHVSEPVGSFDFNPTLLDIAGLPPLENTPAKSLLPLMNGAQGPGVTFSEVSGDYGDTPYFASVTDGAYRLSIDARANNPVEFCDLINDPTESNNLVKDETQQKRIAQMHNELLAPHMKDRNTIF